MMCFYIVYFMIGVVSVIRIPVIHYKKVIFEDKEYFLISGCKWCGWWEFLAYDWDGNLYDIEVYYYPEQEKELDEILLNPEVSYRLEKYQSVVVNNLTYGRLLAWNIINMEEEREEENIFEEWEKHPLKEVVKSEI